MQAARVLNAPNPSIWSLALMTRPNNAARDVNLWRLFLSAPSIYPSSSLNHTAHADGCTPPRPCSLLVNKPNAAQRRCFFETTPTRIPPTPRRRLQTYSFFLTCPHSMGHVGEAKPPLLLSRLILMFVIPFPLSHACFNGENWPKY